MSTATLSMDDLVDVQEELYDARSHWYNLGLKLRLHAYELDNIRENYSGDTKKCFLDMLKGYLKTTIPPPSWFALVEALKSKMIAEHRLAEKIRKKYCSEHLKLQGMHSFLLWVNIEVISAKMNQQEI